MTGSTQTLPYTSLGPIRLPPGNLEPVEELPGDSDLEDEGSEVSADFVSDVGLSNVDEEEDDEDRGSLLERDPVFEKIKETLSKTQGRSESVASAFSSISDTSDGPHVQISDQYTSVPYGIQPRATYEHSSLHADIMGVAYNGRMRQFVILDSKGITTWKRDLVDPRVRRALQFPKYEYRLIMNIVYAPKYNCYFALGKDFSVKVLNRDFEETCSVHTDMRSVLYILFNPIRDELITGGVGGIKIWQFQQAAGKAFTELKPLANYELRLKETLPNVGGSWVKRVDLDYNLQHLYCCSDTDLHVYDLSGKLLFKFERAHTMSITGCCFSMSAKVLITSSVDSEVKVWSLTGGLVHTFRGHSRAVTGLLLHPETSSIIITASLDGSIRMWSLETMDLLYMIVVSADGVMWMGLTDDKLLYISTCRNITLWHLNNFCTFWSLARNQVSHLSLASCEEKTTRVLAVGDDSSVRMFTRSNRKNITTVLPPPDISPLQKVLSVCYSREKNAAFLLITNREIWVYTTRTDPSCRIAKWDVHDLQMPYISGDTSNLPPGVVIQPPSQSMSTHRATENGHGNEMISNCCSLCILNSTAMMWTDEGLSCPIRHTYLLLGMEDGRILFMDPVIKGQKYMEFKASKDSIQDMHHDVAHSCLITVCRLKTLVMIQIWGLPQLDAMYELYCGPDITCYARVGLSFLTGHSSGQINHYFLEQVEDLGMVKSKQEPSYESVVDENRRPEHQAPLVAMDSLHTLGLFVTCSSDGAIKVWDDGKVLMTEVMLEESLSTACFLNEMGDLLVGFKNHIFYIDHSKLCPAFKPPEIELETSDQESDVYEDPRVLYELIKQDEEPVTIDNYLVPYDHIEFDKDFLEGKTKIEQPKTAAEAAEISESETETDISLAPSSIYLSPAESIESLSMIDLTLGADYSKHDLRKQMKTTLDYMVAKGMKRRKHVSIETPGQSDLEEKELESEVEKFTLPAFGESPGGSPSITPPSGQASPRQRGQHSTYEEYEDMSEEERSYKKPSGFVPVQPEQGILAQSPTPSEHGSAFTQTLSPVSVTPKNISSSPTISDRQIHKPTPVKHKPSKQDQNVQQSNSFQSKPQSVQFQKDSQSQGRTFPVLKTFGPVPVSKPSGQSVQTGRPGQSNLEKSQQQRSSFSLESTTQSKKHPISTSLAHKGTGAEIKGQMKIDSSNIKTQSPSQTASQKQQTTPKSNLKLLNSATDQTPPSPSEKTKPGISNPIRVSLSESGEFSKVLQALLEAESDESEEDIEKVPDKLETKSVTSDTDETKEFVAETDSKSDAQSDKDSGLAASMVTLSHRMDSELQSIPDSLVTVETVETGPENLTRTEIIKKSESKDTDTETSKPQDSSLQDTQKHTDGKWEPSLMENDETMISISSEVTSSGGRIEEPQAVYGDMDDKQEAPGPRRLKGMKVDVRGLMKKRRITSARAPSLTRRSSTDHSHDDHDHDHDHDHTHDDKRSKRDLKKKQPMDNRKMPPRLDKNKLLNMPPNPPSMLSRKRSLSEQRKSLELNLLHHPDFRRDHHHLNQNDMEEANMPHIQFGDPDMDTLQDQQWAQEASVLGTTLTLPPQRDKNKARLQNQPGKTDLRSQRLRDRKFGDKDPVEGQTPGVGSSPTAELEDDKMEVDKEQSPTAKDKDAAGNENAAEGGLSAQTKDGKDREVDSLINPDTNIPETQMQRAQRLGLKVDADKVFDNEKAEKTDGLPKALVRKSQKISIYIPQAEQEMPTSAKSSRRGTPDSGIDDSLSTPGRQTPFVPVIKLPDEDELNKNKQEEDINKDESLLTDEDKANAIRRPASSFTGLRRGQLEGERLRAERPHTAHVRFKAEDLQSAFEDALKKYQTLPGTPSIVSPEKLYKNDGIAFEDNWQERVIERHTLLRMQKEIRAQSAAQRRQAIEMIQKDKQSTKLFTSRCDSAIGGMSQTESSLHTSRRATTSMSVPITLGYGVGNSAPPPTRDKHRPKTANPVMEKQQMMKNELSQEKPFRYRLSKGGPQVSRPASSRSISTVGDFSPHWIDPRNPDAWRPKSSRSIPSKCNRYVLVNKPKEKPAAPVPSPLEEQLLVERFPRMGQKLVHTLPLPEPSSARMKQTYGMEYSPFIYQRYV